MLSLRYLLASLAVLGACGEVVHSSDPPQNTGGTKTIAGASTTTNTDAGRGGMTFTPTGGTGGGVQTSTPTGGTTPMPETGGTPGEGGAGIGAAGEPSTLETLCGAEFNFSALSTNDTHVVAVGGRLRLNSDGSCQNEGVIYSSLDGRNWQLRATVPSRVTDVTFGNGVFVAIAPPLDLYVSKDAVTWAPITTGASGLATRLSFGNEVFLAATSSGAPSLLRSKDGRSWEALDRDMPSINQYRSGTRFAAGTFVVWGSGPTVYTTTGGDAVTASKFPVDDQHNPAHSLGTPHVVNDRFVSDTWYNCCFGETGGPWTSYIESKDGFIWKWQGPERARQYYSIPWVETASLCISIAVTVIHSGPDCAHTSPAMVPPKFTAAAATEWKGVYLAVGSGIAHSTDGKVWERTL
ncbi:MAG TPA: hypothetical protein VFQ61_36340 [Polyangiaceae bacterium]|nr:hypothetical protein [Polyangiaceae bacterium]